MTEREWLAEHVPEQDWLSCRSMEGMPSNLDYCFGRCGVLFAAACCRTVWHLLPDEPGRTAVLAAERYAGGDATREELEASEQRSYEAAEAMFGSMPDLAWKTSPPGTRCGPPLRSPGPCRAGDRCRERPTTPSTRPRGRRPQPRKGGRNGRK